MLAVLTFLAFVASSASRTPESLSAVRRGRHRAARNHRSGRNNGRRSPNDHRAQVPLSIAQLRAELAGPVIGPGEPGYDEARRVFLPSVDRRPAAIVRPVDAGEVARVVSLARETGLELAVRGGGHS